MGSNLEDSMNKRKIIVTIMSISMIAIMLRLGFWQVERLEWKENLLAKIESQMNGKASTQIPSEITDLEAWDYRRISAKGNYLHKQEFFLPHRVFKGKDGKHLITPFKMDDDRIILVNRGWVDKQNMGNIIRDNNEIELSGVLKIPNVKNYFTPENTIDTKYLVDIKEIGLENNFDKMVNLLLYLDKQDNDNYPIAGQVQINIPNDHFQYMIFWFFMGFVQFVIFVIYMKQDSDVKNESI